MVSYYEFIRNTEHYNKKSKPSAGLKSKLLLICGLNSNLTRHNYTNFCLLIMCVTRYLSVLQTVWPYILCAWNSIIPEDANKDGDGMLRIFLVDTRNKVVWMVFHLLCVSPSYLVFVLEAKLILRRYVVLQLLFLYLTTLFQLL